MARHFLGGATEARVLIKRIGFCKIKEPCSRSKINIEAVDRTRSGERGCRGHVFAGVNVFTAPVDRFLFYSLAAPPRPCATPLTLRCALNGPIEFSGRSIRFHISARIKLAIPETLGVPPTTTRGANPTTTTTMLSENNTSRRYRVLASRGINICANVIQFAEFGALNRG